MTKNTTPTEAHEQNMNAEEEEHEPNQRNESVDHDDAHKCLRGRFKPRSHCFWLSSRGEVSINGTGSNLQPRRQTPILARNPKVQDSIPV